MDTTKKKFIRTGKCFVKTKRCSECDRTIRPWNESGLCCYHLTEKKRLERNKRLKLIKNTL